MLEKIKKLSPTVFLLGAVSLLGDISSEMLYPITPVFLTGVLGASMLSLGVIEGLAEAIASLMKAGVGRWSDRIQRRKPFVVLGYLCSALSRPLTAFATGVPLVLFSRGLDRTGKGLRTAPRDALLADSVMETDRGLAFGLHRGMDTAGAAIGPIIAFFYLKSHPEHWRGIFFVSFVFGLLCVGVSTLVKERVSLVKAAPEKGELSKTFKMYLFAWMIFSLTNSSDVFLLLKMKQSGVSLQETVLVYCFYNLVYACSSPVLGSLSDRFGRRPVLIFGLIIFAAIYAGFSFATSHLQYWILFAFYGLYIGATDGVGKAFAVDLTSPEHKGYSLGVLGAVTGVSAFCASVGAGYLWDHVGSGAPFLFGAVGSVTSAILFFALFSGQSNRPYGH